MFSAILYSLCILVVVAVTYWVCIDALVSYLDHLIEVEKKISKDHPVENR